MAWHYTIEDRVRGILKAGVINPATAGVPKGEKPVVWFSRNPRWEPTANKIAIHHSGQVRHLTTKEMFSEVGDQLYRFGMPTEELLPWHVLKRKARIKTKEQRRMLASAKEAGSDPLDWCGSLTPVPIAGCILEKWSPIAKLWITIEVFDEGEVDEQADG